MAGRLVEAREVVDQAAGLATENSWDSASLKTQKADLLLSLGDAQGAEMLLRRALEEAQRAGGRMLELRAATRRPTGGAGFGARRESQAAKDRGVLHRGRRQPDVLEARGVARGGLTRTSGSG